MAKASAFLHDRFQAGDLKIAEEFCGHVASLSEGHPYALQLMGFVLYAILIASAEPVRKGTTGDPGAT